MRNANQTLWRLLACAYLFRGDVKAAMPSLFDTTKDVLSQRNAVLLEHLQRISLQGLRLQPEDGNYTKDKSIFTVPDASGRQQTCTVQLARTDTDGGDNSQAENRVALVDFLQQLGNVCVTHEDGHWTYEWCHRKQVTQYHRSPGSGKITVVWNLGTYNHSSAPGTDLSVYFDAFTSGQPCDETGNGRQTQVRFLCCPKRHSGGGGSSDRTMAAEASPLTIQAVQELQQCHYLISVCVPQLCDKSGRAPSASRAGRFAAAAAAAAGSVSSAGARAAPAAVVRENDFGKQTAALFRGQCWLRHEGWWTYEVCFARHVRQFHIKIIKSGKVHKQMLEQEYLLGTANATRQQQQQQQQQQQAASANNSTQWPVRVGGFVVVATGLTEATESAAVLDEDRNPVDGLYVMEDDRKARTTLRHYFRHGDACRTDGGDGIGAHTVNRSTEVHYMCSREAASPAGVLSIAEVSTCSYLAIVHLPALCTHPSFHVPPLPIHQLQCHSTDTSYIHTGHHSTDDAPVSAAAAADPGPAARDDLDASEVEAKDDAAVPDEESSHV